MQFSTKCWSEHILSAYKATKNLKHPLYMTFKKWTKIENKAGNSNIIMRNIYVNVIVSINHRTYRRLCVEAVAFCLF